MEEQLCRIWEFKLKTNQVMKLFVVENFCGYNVHVIEISRKSCGQLYHSHNTY